MKKRLLLSLICLCWLPAFAWAAGSATIQTGGSQLTVYWQDVGTVRLDPAEGNQYTVIKDGEMYSVSFSDGQPQVMKMGGMMRAMGEAAKNQASQAPFSTDVQEIQATGRSEKLAGMTGEVYIVTDEKGETHEVVLTDNPLAEEMTRAYMQIINIFAGEEGVDKVMAAFPDGKQGMLRSDDDYRVVSISNDTPADELFELPAKPKDMGQLMQRLQSARGAAAQQGTRRAQQVPETAPQSGDQARQIPQQMQPQINKMKQKLMEMMQQHAQ